MGGAVSLLKPWMPETLKPLNCSAHQLSYLPSSVVPSVQSFLHAACALQLPGIVLVGYVILGFAAVLLLLWELLGRAFK